MVLLPVVKTTNKKNNTVSFSQINKLLPTPEYLSKSPSGTLQI